VPSVSRLPACSLADYAYRVAISSGYITGANGTLQGETASSEPQGSRGLAGTLSFHCSWSADRVPGRTNDEKLTRAQQLARALRACRRTGQERGVWSANTGRRKYARSPSQPRRSRFDREEPDARVDTQTRHVCEVAMTLGSFRDDRWRLRRQEIPDHIDKRSALRCSRAAEQKRS